MIGPTLGMKVRKSLEQLLKEFRFHPLSTRYRAGIFYKGDVLELTPLLKKKKKVGKIVDTLE